MHIVLQTAAANAGRWLAELAAALPEARISQWPDGAAPVDYALVWKPPVEMLEALFRGSPQPRAIFNLGAGVDSLVGMPLLPSAIPVIRLEDAGMAAQMIEYVTLAVLADFRESAHYAAAQRDGRWEPRRRRAKADFAIGLLGLGILGSAVAGALGALGFPLRGWSRTRKSLPGIRTFAGAAELSEFLARTRVLVCLLPSTAETRSLLDRDRLAQLPRGASLVNVARGDIVVDDHLIEMLDSGQLGHATLDVFRNEPLPPTHPFWRHPRITVTPHVSAVTLVEESVAQIAAKIRRLEQGLPVTGVVDRRHNY